MNRLTAVLLAMAALLVHVLAIHRDKAGHLAHSFDAANVAYELGIAFADSGEAHLPAVEGADAGDLSSYPSPLLVWFAALLRLLSTNVERAVQLFGVLGALATVFLSTRFDTDRIAGVIPALLLVSSGAVAATGASGTEWPFAMVALATSFVALEHGRARFAAIGLTMLVLSSAPGVIAGLALAAQTLVRRLRKVPGDPGAPLWPFAVAAAAFAGAVIAGSALGPELQLMARFEAAVRAQGLLQLRDHLVSTVTPVLLVFPLYGLVRGGLSAQGRRALTLTIVWCVAVALRGGGPAPFAIAFAPALPLAFMAIQQGMARVLDTYRRSMEQLVWASLAVAITGALLASRFPGNFGRFELRGAHERAFAMEAAPTFGDGEILGRASLYSEIRRGVQMREIADFLGQRLPAETTVLSPWPGTLLRRSGLTVLDAFGRATALPGKERAPWTPLPGVFDARAALDHSPDLILTAINGLGAYQRGELDEFLSPGLLGFDPTDDDELRREIRAALARYELVVTVGMGAGRRVLEEPLLLLQRRGLGRVRRLGRKDVDGGVQLTVCHEGLDTEDGGGPGGLPQLFDVLLTATLEDGSLVVIQPDGAPATADVSLSGVWMDPLWSEEITLAELREARLAELPSPPLSVEVRLIHHRIDPGDPRADAAAPLVLSLP